MPGFDDDQSTRHASLGQLSRVQLVGARVEVVGGPDVGLAEDVSASGMLIGSSADADLRLTDKLISRQHLRLRAEPEGLLVEDLGSLNGSFFAGARFRALTITEDAMLNLGNTSLRVSMSKNPLDVEVSSRTQFGDAVGCSRAMKHVFALLEAAARGDVTILLEGQSGVGKDVLGRAVHQESARADGPFVVVDCGAIPAQLIESELFGHEKGAFTGAVAARAGAFEQAHGGTLFLDEIGELPLESQPKLLRALEARSFRRVGGATTIDVDVRVVAATNRRLREAVRSREFREDLFYRLAVVQVYVPPLCERPEDIAPIAEGFLQRLRPGGTLPGELMALLQAYDWPGNARELRNVVERFTTFDKADAQLLFGVRAEAETESAGGHDVLAGLDRIPYHDAKLKLIEAFHREVLPKVLERAGGNVARAAEILELPRASLYRMLKDIDLGPGKK